MKVLYYTSPAFLDIAVEVINILKQHVELHVLIELTPGSKISNILEVDSLPTSPIIKSISEIIKKEDFKYLEPYFNGCASADFIIHPNKYGYSFSTIKASYELWLFIKRIAPDIIHLEAMSLRSLGIVPHLFSKKKVFITIHDVIPHSSKKNWKISAPRFLYLNIPYSKCYFFYSQFSLAQFEKRYKNSKYRKYTLKMRPYSFYKGFAKTEILHDNYILFFGSLSSYKGIKILISAMALVLKEFPNENLVIAGTSKEDNLFNEENLQQIKSRITVLNRYIPSNELTNLIRKSKFVVCPYLEATQSGVLMTSYALNKPVVASSVGAFPEYIEENVTGILVPANDKLKLADKIILALKDNFYETMEENISIKNKTQSWSDNLDIILKAYSS